MRSTSISARRHDARPVSAATTAYSNSASKSCAKVTAASPPRIVIAGTAAGSGGRCPTSCSKPRRVGAALHDSVEKEVLAYCASLRDKVVKR